MSTPALLRSRGESRSAAARPRVTQLRGRRALLVRLGVWAALAAGPVALLHAVGSPAPVAVKPAAASRPTAVQPTAVVAGEAGPAGFAETVIGLWLECGTAAEPSAALAQLRLLAPGVRAPRWDRHPLVALQVAAVRTVRAENGGWAVTVAARLADAVAGVPAEQSARGLRFFMVPVTETGTGADRVFVAGAPMEISGPQDGRAPVSPYTARVDDPALTDTVHGFLSAFLGAGGGAERYLAPGTALARPETRFTGVESLQVLAQGRPPAVGQEGATTRVRAEVTATDSAGREWPMAYAITLTARGGRWEIASLDTTPASARS
ncbi:conjugal transfer protein [Streptomyces roseolus]